MDLEHKVVGHCGQLTRMHIKIKATRKGAITIIKVFHMHSWVGTVGSDVGGKGCSHN